MKLALAGDTMLGRLVADRLHDDPPEALIDPAVVTVVHEADLFVLNLECAISERGQRWPDPRKPFFFRAPRIAVDVLTLLGVDCVTLANNHALDYGATALLDTIELLDAAGIAHVGAGADEQAARQPAVLRARDVSVGVVGVADHPEDFAAGPTRPGIAFADLRRGGPPVWLIGSISELDTDVVVVTPHWGPNMVTAPVGHVRAAAPVLREAGATLVAGHSAHVFHGVGNQTLYDLGDFIDDYAVDPVLRNDLGLLFLVTFDGAIPASLEAIPIALDLCHTRLASGDEAGWILHRFRRACAELGTEVAERDGRLIIDWAPTG